jgi:predicted secreted protein
MPAKTGRNILITWDSIDIAAREKTITLGGEPLDVSDDSSEGWRVLLSDEVGEKSVTIAFSGLTKDSALRLKNNTQAVATITFPGSQGDMTGTFQLTGYNETGNYKEAIEFSAELQSTGAIAIAADA